MINATLTAALLLMTAGTHAAIVGVVPLQSGAMLRLHNTAGPCVNDALLIEYVAPGKPPIAGCWAMRNDVIFAAFMDADSTKFPAAVVKPPESI